MPFTSDHTSPRWWQSFAPQALMFSPRERALACLCAGSGTLLAGWLSYALLGDLNPWFIAPVVASAVLVFAVPASPLAQPWSVIGGNLVSALVGVACVRFVSIGFLNSGHPAGPLANGELASASVTAAGLAGAQVLTAALAVALAIGAMFVLRCLHPPGGAVAATAVLGGPKVAALGFGFAFAPTLVNSVCMVAAALLLNNLLRHHRYPHVAQVAARGHATADLLPSERVGFTRADLDAVIRDYDELLDVSEDDLEDILRQVEQRVFARRAGPLRCADIMSRDVIRVDVGAPVELAWELLEHHNVRALPVTDEVRGLVGIVTLRDLVAAGEQALPRRSRDATVASVMTRAVYVAQPEQGVGALVALLSDQGLHHLPVVDAERRLVGMISQSDLIAALFRVVQDAH